MGIILVNRMGEDKLGLSTGSRLDSWETSRLDVRSKDLSLVWVWLVSVVHVFHGTFNILLYAYMFICLYPQIQSKLETDLAWCFDYTSEKCCTLVRIP